MLGGNVDIQTYRNKSYQDDLRRAKFIEERVSNKSLLDFGCGAGGLLHLLKDKTFSIAGLEIDKTINEYINNEGFKCYTSIEQINKKYDFITLFHVLEHLPDPMKILKELKEHLNPNGKIFIEVPNSDDALLTLYHNDAFADFTYWSCHLYLYNSTTLAEVCTQAGFQISSIKQVQRYSLSNHLYWMTNNLPGGHENWDFFNSSQLNTEYAKQLSAIGKCDTLFAEITI